MADVLSEPISWSGPPATASRVSDRSDAPADGVKSRPALPTYLTVAQVAAQLQLHPVTIQRMAASDASMPAVRFGRVIRFEQQALLRWLARKGRRTAT